MSEYLPDRWVVLKLTTPGYVLYKVFGGWFGGFADGDSWKLNSGITKVEAKDEELLFHGYSGSVYVCHPAAYGMSGYMASVLDSFQYQATQTEGVTIEVMPEDTNFLEIEYQ